MIPPAKNILIIENEAIIALDIKSCFQKAGHYILGTTPSLRDAFSNVKKYKNADLILIDTNIPDFLPLLSRIEKLNKSLRTPLIILNSRLDDHTKSICKDCSNVRIVEMPIDNEEFESTIKETLQLAN